MNELLSKDTGDDTKEAGENHAKRLSGISFDKEWRKEIENNGLTLTHVEAETLRDRFVNIKPDSLPAALMSDKTLWEIYQGITTEDNLSKGLQNSFVLFVKKTKNMIKNQTLARNLQLAHDLSYFLHGAHIAYNIQLRSKVAGTDELVANLRSQGVEWRQKLQNLILDYDGFNIDECMEGVNVQGYTRKFLQDMQTLMHTNEDWQSMEKELCALAERQERQNKKTKSRFLKLDKEQVVDGMDKQWLGLPLFEYRYMATRRILSDVYQGLE